MKRSVVMMSLVAILSIVGLSQATTVDWHWWTDVVGSEVDAAGNTWYVFLDKGVRQPSNFFTEWQQLDFAEGYGGGDGAWGYVEDGTIYSGATGMKYIGGRLDNQGSWWAIGFAILVPADATYSFSGAVPLYAFDAPTVTVSVANENGSFNRVLADFTASPTTQWSDIAALQNIQVKAGQFILIGTGSSGGWVMAGIDQIDITIAVPAAPVLSVSPELAQVDSSAGTVDFSVNNSGAGGMSWTAQVISGGDWLTITNGASGVDSGTISASFGENTTAERTATIRVTAGGATGSPKDITVTQPKAGVKVVPWHWWTDKNGGEVDAAGNSWAVYLDRGLQSPANFKAEGNDGWSELVCEPEYGNVGAWFCYEDDGTGSYYRVHPNMKYTNSRIDNEGSWWAMGFTVQAPQNGLYSFSGTVAHYYYSNFLTVTVSVAEADGMQDRVISSFTLSNGYDWASNPDLQNIEVKTGQYLVIGTGSSGGGGWVAALMSDIKLKVEATDTPILNVTPATQNVDASAGTTTFTVSNTGVGSMPWMAQVISGGEWVTLSGDTMGMNSGTITANFTQNTSTTEDRTATIRITAQYAIGSPKDVTIVQAKAVEVTRIPGDANGDNMVDVGDLGILAANYGGSGKTWAEGDFNGDHMVDVGDLGILAANYGMNASAADWSTDYAKAFGTTVSDDDENDLAHSSICGALGLPLIAGLMLAGLLLVKLEE